MISALKARLGAISPAKFAELRRYYPGVAAILADLPALIAIAEVKDVDAVVYNIPGSLPRGPNGERNDRRSKSKAGIRSSDESALE